MWRSRSSSWHVNVSDFLQRILDNNTMDRDSVEEFSVISNMVHDDTDEEANAFSFQSIFGDIFVTIPFTSTLIEHNVNSVNVENDSGKILVNATIDNMHVQLSYDSRIDLFILMLIEEIAALVGCDDLFKRSLLLIRAWWTYETSIYSSNTVKHYLSELSISIMTIAIFNQYHQNIHHPIQALCIFLAEYSTVDWSEHAITIQGVVTFREEPIYHHRPKLKPPSKSHLLTGLIMSKYWDAIVSTTINGSTLSASDYRSSSSKESNVEPSTTRESAESISNTHHTDEFKAIEKEIVSGEGQLMRSASFKSELTDEILSNNVKLELSNDDAHVVGEEGSAVDHDEIQSVRSHTSDTEPTRDSSDSKTIDVRKDYVEKKPTAVNQDEKYEFPDLTVSFVRRGINIVHPFSHSNIANDRANERRSKRLGEIFQTGARNLNTALDYARQGTESINIPVLSFFRVICSRFGGRWRPDVLGQSLSSEGSYKDQDK
jgi:hypothetical protein